MRKKHLSLDLAEEEVISSSGMGLGSREVAEGPRQRDSHAPDLETKSSGSPPWPWGSSQNVGYRDPPDLNQDHEG